MRGRLFDARLGRFTKADPFITEPFNPQGLNRYAYVHNNPLNFVDPSGFYDEAADQGYYGYSGQGQGQGTYPQVSTPTYHVEESSGSAAPTSGGYYSPPTDQNMTRGSSAAQQQSVAEHNSQLVQKGDAPSQTMVGASAAQTRKTNVEQTSNAARAKDSPNSDMKQPAAPEGEQKAETPGYIRAASIVGLGVPFVGPLATMHDPNASDDEKGWALAWMGVDAATLGIGAVVRTGGKAVKAGAEFLGRGSTAAIEKGSSLARNLRESLAIKQTMANPSAGRQLPTVMNDARWLAREGWVKMEQVVASGGREGQIVVHYVRNTISGAIDDFKIILSGAR